MGGLYHSISICTQLTKGILSSTDMRIEGGSDAESITVSNSAGEANLALKNVNITNSTGSAFSTGNNDVYIELEAIMS